MLALWGGIRRRSHLRSGPRHQPDPLPPHHLAWKVKRHTEAQGWVGWVGGVGAGGWVLSNPLASQQRNNQTCWAHQSRKSVHTVVPARALVLSDKSMCVRLCVCVCINMCKCAEQPTLRSCRWLWGVWPVSCPAEETHTTTRVCEPGPLHAVLLNLSSG